LIRFLFTAIVLALSLPPLVNFSRAQEWISAVPSFLYETTWLVASTTTILFVYLFRSGKANFVQLYLLSMVIKLIAYFSYALIIILDDRKSAVANVVYFLLVYAIFTVVEIVFLYRKISSRSGL